MWSDGWDERRRVAGRLGGRCEIGCGLTGGGERRRVAGRLEGKAEFPCGLTDGMSVGALLDVWEESVRLVVV